MVSVPGGIVPLILRATRGNKTYISAEGAHKRVRERALNPAPFGPPRNLRSDVHIDVRHEDSWPICNLTPKKHTPIGNVVYLHGRGWVNEIATQHWQLAAQIAAEASSQIGDAQITRKSKVTRSAPVEGTKNGRLLL